MAVAVPSGTSICPRGRISEVFWGKLPKNSTKAVVPGDGEPASYIIIIFIYYYYLYR